MSEEFEVIVVGSGMSGGWAAKEFTEKGFKTLLLERGRPVEHGADYIGEGLDPWDMKFRDKVDRKLADRDYPIQKQCYAFKESTKHFFVKDTDYPYETPKENPFLWIRGDHLGGRSLQWHRQSYRLGDLDFEANKKDGHGTDWPIRYKDIAKWYDHVEVFAGISGSIEGLPQLPDGQFLPPIEMNCVEKELQGKFKETYEDRRLIIGRCAHLTAPQKVHTDLGRGTCQSRNQCQRGCSFGAYFSSQSATLPAAERTGNLTTVTHAIVERVLYDAKSRKATGVRVIDAQTKEVRDYRARVIFLCASTFGTTQILLNSTSEAFPRGFANSSDAVGRYLMDHLCAIGAVGEYPGFEDHYYLGRRPTGIYIPRFKNLRAQTEDYVRGFGYQGDAWRDSWRAGLARPGFGADFKESFKTPGPWKFALEAYGEMLPRADNRVTLHPTKTDKFGLPQLHIDCSYGENDKKMQKDMLTTTVDMLKELGLQNVKGYSDNEIPGLAIHEMGTARMGRDPRTSVLNGYNQCHDVDNVFITDGSAMASSACQNPSLTYMALTARAVDYASRQMQANLL
ncbi:GMC oxidoreductase [Paremcibacter congregatus]|uniref:GMC family oxidoreductase n=1 Tax=Paremcibacter congregatus TaxID=2043170 RepID=A0A2G4YW99_9PROT|nr:GMC family oxidoreductase [Paremcibacter congregatus]PHZ86617.1 GMC family oxidoreductase [Paremcibacter congregatus]QDE26419.1 GMC family oxidoreductase [Paremcibacter congregatus]